MHNGGFTKRTTSRSGRPSSAVAELLFIYPPHLCTAATLHVICIVSLITLVTKVTHSLLHKIKEYLVCPQNRSVLEPKYCSKFANCSFSSTQALIPFTSSVVHNALQWVSIKRCLPQVDHVSNWRHLHSILRHASYWIASFKTRTIRTS